MGNDMTATKKGGSFCICYAMEISVLLCVWDWGGVGFCGGSENASIQSEGLVFYAVVLRFSQAEFNRYHWCFLL